MKALTTGRKTWLYIIMLMQVSYGFSQSVGFEGMLAGWGTLSYSEKLNGQLGARYIPQLNFESPLGDRYKIDAELSANIWGSSTFWSNDSINLDEDLKPYRMWVRFSGDQFEVRAGLQKINFGSANMLRPLMWFDRIDPRDPLQLTDGCYGILARYYFLNNANIWVWGLIGNKEPKGWEMFGSEKNRPEFGGRIQVPVFTGEIGLSYHNRSVDVPASNLGGLVNRYFAPENRFALDAKVDIGVGLWFEGSLVHTDYHTLYLDPYTRSFTAGADYTFGVGNGLGVMTEVFNYCASDKAFSGGDGVTFQALSVTYPLTIFTSLSGIVFYDWENDDLYNFINCTFTFDKWTFYLMGFWNPDRFQVFPGSQEVNLFAGKGIQMMAVFNH
jgi:hypothetical protein